MEESVQEEDRVRNEAIPHAHETLHRAHSNLPVKLSLHFISFNLFVTRRAIISTLYTH